jgi:hypothetical protein
VRKVCAQHDIQIDRFTLRSAKHGGELIELRCRIKRADDVARASQELRVLPGVTAVRADVPGLKDTNSVNSE